LLTSEHFEEFESPLQILCGLSICNGLKIEKLKSNNQLTKLLAVNNFSIQSHVFSFTRYLLKTIDYLIINRLYVEYYRLANLL